MLLQTILTNEISLNLGVLLTLTLVSVLYNRFVIDRMDADGNDGWEWFQVSVGVAYTLAAGGFVYGIEFTIQALILFIFSGVPMILGALWRREKRAKKLLSLMKDANDAK